MHTYKLKTLAVVEGLKRFKYYVTQMAMSKRVLISRIAQRRSVLIELLPCELIRQT